MEGSTATRVQELSREESLRLLQYNSHVGRLAFTAAGRTTIRPVNYVADDDAIVFCTSPGRTLTELGEDAQVAFEVDAARPLYHAGWSVIVHGTAREVTDPSELERLRRGPLRSWAARSTGRWIRISIEEISGRQIPGS